MKIALVIERFDPAGGGAERSAVQIARELSRRGHELTVLCGDAPDDLALEGIDIRRAGTVDLRQHIRIGAFARWSRRQLDACGCDVSLSMTMSASADAVQPRTGTIRENLIRNVATRTSALGRMVKRSALALRPKVRTLLRLEQRTLTDRRVKRLVAVSQYVADQLVRHYAVDARRITVIPNAGEVPTLSEQQRQAYRDQVRRGFGVVDDAVAFMFASYNPKLKGAGPLLHAMPRVVERYDNAVLLMAGHIGYAQQHLAASLGVREHVRMIGPTSRMAELYCAADATVLPTFYDAASKVVIESLMMGVPAITTRFNGAADLITGDNGTLRGRVIDDPNDVAALAEAMTALADPAERKRCADATAGLADVLSMTRHVDQLERLMRDLSAGGDGGAT